MTLSPSTVEFYGQVKSNSGTNNKRENDFAKFSQNGLSYWVSHIIFKKTFVVI